LRYFTFPPGALIVSNIKAWGGAVALSDGRDNARIVSNRFLPYVVKADAEADLGYAYEYLTSKSGLAALGAASPGSADRHRTLAIERFEAILIPLPPLEQQRRVGEVRLKLEALGNAVSRGSVLASAISPSQLNGVFSGRL
jgi:type I restriction enzyme, S subunit